MDKTLLMRVKGLVDFLECDWGQRGGRYGIRSVNVHFVHSSFASALCACQDGLFLQLLHSKAEVVGHIGGNNINSHERTRT